MDTSQILNQPRFGYLTHIKRFDIKISFLLHLTHSLPPHPHPNINPWGGRIRDWINLLINLDLDTSHTKKSFLKFPFSVYYDWNRIWKTKDSVHKLWMSHKNLWSNLMESFWFIWLLYKVDFHIIGKVGILFSNVK